VPSPAGFGFHRVTAVQETKEDVSLWHIAHISYTFGKSCWANHTGTKKKCTARIVTNNKSVSAPTYTGIWHHYKLQSMKRTDFVFCPDDIERCVKGPRRKWFMPFSVDDQKPPIPPIWPVKIGTNLTRSEIFALENAGFSTPTKGAHHTDLILHQFCSPAGYVSNPCSKKPRHDPSNKIVQACSVIQQRTFGKAEVDGGHC
jgi:hypothetical protein